MGVFISGRSGIKNGFDDLPYRLSLNSVLDATAGPTTSATKSSPGSSNSTANAPRKSASGEPPRSEVEKAEEDGQECKRRGKAAIHSQKVIDGWQEGCQKES